MFKDISSLLSSRKECREAIAQGVKVCYVCTQAGADRADQGARLSPILLVDQRSRQVAELYNVARKENSTPSYKHAAVLYPKCKADLGFEALFHFSVSVSSSVFIDSTRPQPCDVEAFFQKQMISRVVRNSEQRVSTLKVHLAAC